MRLKSRWGCQNHPEASTATSFEGRLGVVGISGQMLLPLAKAYREDAIDLDLMHEKMMAAMERRPIAITDLIVIVMVGFALEDVPSSASLLSLDN